MYSDRQTDRQTGGRAEWHDTLLLLISDEREGEREREEGLNEGEERERERERRREEPARQGELINLFLFP